MTETFTREELVKCVEREVQMRERVYPREVALGKMTGRKMTEEIALMRAVLQVVRAMPSKPPAQGALFGGRGVPEVK